MSTHCPPRSYRRRRSKHTSTSIEQQFFFLYLNLYLPAQCRLPKISSTISSKPAGSRLTVTVLSKLEALPMEGQAKVLSTLEALEGQATALVTANSTSSIGRP